MSPSAIIQRISVAAATGALVPLPDHSAAVPLRTVGDLLRPWHEVYPGIEPDTDIDHRDLFCWGGLRKPSFTPRPRGSRRPLPAPLAVAAPRKLVNPGIFASVRGIWDWCQSRGSADPVCLQEPLTPEGLGKLLFPLVEHLFNYYPLGCLLEQAGYEEDIVDLRGLALLLPHWGYEEEWVGAVEAFLCGASGVQSLVTHYYEQRKDMDLDQLPPKDHEVIRTIGFGPLCETYAAFQGEKTCDLVALENFGDTFFHPVYQQYPGRENADYSVITGDAGIECEVLITSREDIEFAIAYHDAFEAMVNAMPDPSAMENNEGGTTDNFIHELCEVWRKTNRKRSVKWTSPKAKRLSHLVKIGVL
jgi:hypothetical protein